MLVTVAEGQTVARAHKYALEEKNELRREQAESERRQRPLKELVE
jgi:hypothetical protein